MSDTPMTREQAWETVKEQVEFSWHGNGCATHVGAEDGGGYCSSNCRQYEALESLRFLRTEMERLEDAYEGRVVAEGILRNDIAETEGEQE